MPIFQWVRGSQECFLEFAADLLHVSSELFMKRDAVLEGILGKLVVDQRAIRGRTRLDLQAQLHEAE
jgi:hypothetical protein